jgi:hypothetical protein
VIPDTVIFAALQAFDQELRRQRDQLPLRRVVALVPDPKPLALLLCCEGMGPPRSRYPQLTVTVYKELAMAIAGALNDAVAD